MVECRLRDPPQAENPASPDSFLCDRKFLSHKTLREDAHLAEMKYMLRIPLGRERVASDSFSWHVGLILLFLYYSDVSSSILHKIPGMYAIFHKEVIEQLNKAYKSI